MNWALRIRQLISAGPIVEEFVKAIDMPDDDEKFDKAVQERPGLHLDEQSPSKHIQHVTVPALVARAHDDTMARPEDAQSIYKARPIQDKQLRAARRFSSPHVVSRCTLTSAPSRRI